MRSSRIVNSHDEGVEGFERGPLIEGENDSSNPRSGAVRQLNASAYPQPEKVKSGIK